MTVTIVHSKMFAQVIVDYLMGTITKGCISNE